MPNSHYPASVSAALACFLTLLLKESGLTAVQASALVALGCAVPLMLVRTQSAASLALAIFSGSFGGMSVLAGDFLPHALLLSLCVGAAWAGIARITQMIPNFLGAGMGGRLGVIAFLGACVYTLLGTGLTGVPAMVHVAPPSLATLGIYTLIMVVSATFGAILPYRIFRHTLFSFSVPRRVALSAGLTLVVTLPLSLTNSEILTAMAGAFYAGIFVSMSAEKFLPHMGAFFIAGIFCGLLLWPLQSLWGGLGGLLGLSAFLAVALVQAGRRALA